MRLFALSVVVAITAAALPALAQQAPRQAPPARVGRVSLVEGHVAFHAAGETKWSAAAVNYPVATGGSFWTDPHSRAEIRIGMQTVDLGNNTELDVTQLDQQVMKLALPQGRVYLRLRQLGQGEKVEVDIPRGGVWLLQPGRYDIDAGDAGHPARIAAFAGSARFVGGAVDVAIKTGDTAVVSGTQTLTARLEHAAPDQFVEWCRSRAYHESGVVSAYYVSPHMTGYEALDEYGSWRAAPGYGEVWYPRALPAGWAPYRDGYWVWEAPWGWTWIDEEPWGFAPFHYGRWAYLNGAWGWVPGSFVPWPVYAPALVAFVDNPVAILASAVAGPAVGWFPLGPGEPYWPWYSTDRGYIRAINTGIVANPASLAAGPALAGLTFANRAAATVVPRRVFAGAAPVAGAALPVSPRAALRAQVAAAGPGGRGSAAARTGAARAAAAAAGIGLAAASARMHGGGHFAGRRFGGQHFAAHVHGGGHFAGHRFSGPHFAARAHGGGHFAGHRFSGPHFAARGFGGPHFGGGAHFGGGGPHFAGGGGAHFGGGGPHGGGAHFGGGGGGGGHGGGGHGGGKGHG